MPHLVLGEGARGVAGCEVELEDRHGGAALSGRLRLGLDDRKRELEIVDVPGRVEEAHADDPRRERRRRLVIRQLGHQIIQRDGDRVGGQEDLGGGHALRADRGCDLTEDVDLGVEPLDDRLEHQLRADDRILDRFVHDEARDEPRFILGELQPQLFNKMAGSTSKTGDEHEQRGAVESARGALACSKGVRGCRELTSTCLCSVARIVCIARCLVNGVTS